MPVSMLSVSCRHESQRKRLAALSFGTGLEVQVDSGTSKAQAAADCSAASASHDVNPKDLKHHSLRRRFQRE